MQKFEFLQQPLLGELAMSRKKKEERRENNAIYSGHICLCQQPRAAHALRSDQKLVLLDFYEAIQQGKKRSRKISWNHFFVIQVSVYEKILILVNTILIFGGLAGNILFCLSVATVSNLQTVTLLLVNLAMADITVLLICAPFSILQVRCGPLFPCLISMRSF